MKLKSLKAKRSTTVKSTGVKKQAQLERWCAMWQVGLRLADWKITVRYAHSSEFSGHNNGECRANMHDKSAEILILPTDREEDKAEELVLIHELLHLHINNLHVPDERNAEEEQVINCLAEPLYNLMQTIRAK